MMTKLLVVMAMPLFACGASAARLGEDKVDGLRRSLDQPNSRTLEEGASLYSSKGCYTYEEDEEIFPADFQSERLSGEICFNKCMDDNKSPTDPTSYTYFATREEDGGATYCMCGDDEDFVEKITQGTSTLITQEAVTCESDEYELFKMTGEPNTCSNGVLGIESESFLDSDNVSTTVCCDLACGDCVVSGYCEGQDGDCCPEAFVQKDLLNHGCSGLVIAPCVIDN